MNNLFLYGVAVLVWGSTWLAIGFQLGEVAPVVSLVYRFALAAAILFVWCWLRRLPLRFGRQAHGRFMLLGLFLFGLNYIATYSAQQYISSALNAVTFSTMMWLNVINSRLFFGTRIEPKVYLGAALGMLGIVTLFWPEIEVVSWKDETLLGVVWCLGGALLASLGNMVSQRAQQERVPLVQANAWGMFYGTLLLLGVALAGGRPFDFENTTGYIVSLLYLAIFGSVIAFGTYLKLLGRIGAHKAGYAVVMFPAVALLLSVLFEGLEVDLHLIAGTGLVLLGNLAILGLGNGRLGARTARVGRTAFAPAPTAAEKKVA